MGPPCLTMDDGGAELLAAFGPPSGPDPDPALRWALTAVDAALARLAGLGADADTAPAFLEPATAPLAAVVPWAVAANRMACDAAPSLWLLGRTDHLDAIERTVRETADSGDSVHAVRRFRTRLLGGSAAADAELVANP